MSDTDMIVVPELVVRLMEQNARDAAFTTNALLEGYQRENAQLQATLDLIRDRIEYLCTGDYMPTSGALLRALWPAEAEVSRNALLTAADEADRRVSDATP